MPHHSRKEGVETVLTYNRRRAVTRATMSERSALSASLTSALTPTPVSPEGKISYGPTDKVKSPLKVSCTPFVATLSRQNARHTLYGFHISGLLWPGCGRRRFGWWMDILISG